jgi:membrane-bound lytic murein transglycosylase D
MYHKRLLLLGITIIGSGWMYPNQAENFITQKDGSSLYSAGDTTEKVGGAVNPATLTAAVNSNSEGLFSKEVFVAATLGGTNGVRLNPKALSFVADYMKENWDELQGMRNWGRPYFNLIENVLTQYGLPKELKYLAVIESNLKPTALSRVGAVGPWQLMPQTARDLGLKVARGNDERKNYYKSTRAAALYLRDLYNELGDWLLVIAAYNTGTSNVYHAIRRSGSRNFWDLQYYLPTESRIHVKKFIGTQYTFEGQGSVTTLTKEEATEQLSGSSMYVFHRKLSEDELNNAKTVAISGKYHSSVIARYTLLDPVTFSRYNPDFDKVMASSNNSYDLKLPADKMELFAANKYQILNESMQLLLNGDEQTGIAGQGVAVK